MEPEIVICAAILCENGEIIRCHRHGDGMMAARHRGWELYKAEDAGTRQQGFITSRGRYVDRKEGLALQKAAGIPSFDKDGYRYMLFSEDLY